MTHLPDILIVMVDQMQAQLLDLVRASNVSPQVGMPNLRRLRSRATQYGNAFCPAPICTPTRASFQLGESVARHGVIGNDRAMPPDRATLADRFSARVRHRVFRQVAPRRQPPPWLAEVRYLPPEGARRQGASCNGGV